MNGPKDLVNGITVFNLRKGGGIQVLKKYFCLPFCYPPHPPPPLADKILTKIVSSISFIPPWLFVCQTSKSPANQLGKKAKFHSGIQLKQLQNDILNLCYVSLFAIFENDDFGPKKSSQKHFCPPISTLIGSFSVFKRVCGKN